MSRPSVQHNANVPPMASFCVRCTSCAYPSGQSRTVEVDGVRVVIKLIGRKGRRARIAIEAPAGRD